MTVLTDAELERQSVVLAHKLRICELEGELRSASESLSRAERTMREVLQGAGASLQETLRAGIAIAETRGILQRALERPTEGARGGAGSAAPAEPGAPSVHVCKVIPLRVDLGVRFRSRDLLVPDPDGAT